MPCCSFFIWGGCVGKLRDGLLDSSVLLGLTIEGGKWFYKIRLENLGGWVK